MNTAKQLKTAAMAKREYFKTLSALYDVASDDWFEVLEKSKRAQEIAIYWANEYPDFKLEKIRAQLEKLWPETFTSDKAQKEYDRREQIKNRFINDMLFVMA